MLKTTVGLNQKQRNRKKSPLSEHPVNLSSCSSMGKRTSAGLSVRMALAFSAGRVAAPLPAFLRGDLRTQD